MVGAAAKEQYHNDSAFMITMDPLSEDILSTPATRTIGAKNNISQDGTVE